MNKCARLAMALAVAAALLSATGCQKLQARDRLTKGVHAYKAANYEKAIEYFKDAVRLDKDLRVAKLYLATAYMQQYVPGVDTPENNANAQQAIEEYQAVLADDPGRQEKVTSLKGIASLYMNMKKFDQSGEYYKKAIEADPSDPEAYYSVGVIDWTQSYQPRMEERSKAGLRPDEPLKDKKLCAKLREDAGAIIQDGIDNLNKALQLRQDYDDAMAYMNLLYREKADRECDQPDVQKADLKTADDWVNKTMEAKKEKAAKQSGANGITMDQSK